MNNIATTGKPRAGNLRMVPAPGVSIPAALHRPNSQQHVYPEQHAASTNKNTKNPLCNCPTVLPIESIAWRNSLQSPAVQLCPDR